MEGGAGMLAPRRFSLLKKNLSQGISFFLRPSEAVKGAETPEIAFLKVRRTERERGRGRGERREFIIHIRYIFIVVVFTYYF